MNKKILKHSYEKMSFSRVIHILNHENPGGKNQIINIESTDYQEV